MDLLNRPKTHASNMHDLPSTSNSKSFPEFFSQIDFGSNSIFIYFFSKLIRYNID